MSKKYVLPYLPNAIFPPDEHALYKDNFATGNGELSKVIADIMNTKYKCLRCELPIYNKCSVFELNENVEG